jgi:hypothetical protein
VLILRPFDNKVISVSRKKVHCHEMMYAKFDAEYQTRPRIEFKDFTLDKNEIESAIRRAEAEPHGFDDDENVIKSVRFEKEVTVIPDHVLSVKVLSDYRRNI